MGTEKKHYFSIDILRFIACYLVIQVHANAFFFTLSNGGSTIINENELWVSIYGSVSRSAIPIYLMITGYFLFPIKTDIKTFLTDKWHKILLPFIIWCVIYALYQKFRFGHENLTLLRNILYIPINYGVEVGHLWYVYMLAGIYLFAPIVSPFLHYSGKKGAEFYLLIWSITLFLPYIHLLFPIIWGECGWNKTSMPYYFSGLLGYVILGYYLKTYVKSKEYLIGCTFLIAGFIITCNGFLALTPFAKTTQQSELIWGYDTFNVAMIGIGIFLLCKNINIKNEVLKGIMIKASKLNYAVYLIHMIVLNFIYAQLHTIISKAVFLVPIMSVLTLIFSYIIIYLISFIPGQKYLTGQKRNKLKNQ